MNYPSKRGLCLIKTTENYQRDAGTNVGDINAVTREVFYYFEYASKNYHSNAEQSIIIAWKNHHSDTGALSAVPLFASLSFLSHWLSAVHAGRLMKESWEIIISINTIMLLHFGLLWEQMGPRKHVRKFILLPRGERVEKIKNIYIQQFLISGALDMDIQGLWCQQVLSMKQNSKKCCFAWLSPIEL